MPPALNASRVRSQFPLWNSKALPCQSFDPGRVIELKIPPPAKPRSAGRLAVSTFNCIALSTGCTRTAVARNGSWLRTPSFIHRFAVGACPFTETNRFRAGSRTMSNAGVGGVTPAPSPTSSW